MECIGINGPSYDIIVRKIYKNMGKPEYNRFNKQEDFILELFGTLPIHDLMYNVIER